MPNRNLLNKNTKRGMAIVISLVVSFCLLLLFVALNMRQSSTASHNQITLQERQALFSARAAMQHFLLKIKLFPTELYDAVELAQGKNPIFDFSEFEAKSETNDNAFVSYSIPGKESVYIRVLPSKEYDMYGQPKYFYHPLPGKDAFIRLGSFTNPDYRFLLKNSASSDPEKKYLSPAAPPIELKADKYLKYFIRDCTNQSLLTANLQPALDMTINSEISKIKNFDIAKHEGYPYTMNYSVSEVKIQSIQGLRKYGEEALEISVEGIATNFQGKSKSQTHKRIQKITRKGSIE
ncbi:MAG: hypothetical protein PHF08_01805 [Candidatus Riflebacteria bacterium]|nr:hypothetical protein [Candidatus Riflebacteria bacterium]MDD2624410.1 hypothetical protein [Candidatus Riflebacteria bacterium]MDD3376165.1 hypothetical protein [Candidatus Riflebacteria bacterium]NLV94948.1 hypothetical protein [Candidatus Riflebacteria bacterium]